MTFDDWNKQEQERKEKEKKQKQNSQSQNGAAASALASAGKTTKSQYNNTPANTNNRNTQVTVGNPGTYSSGATSRNNGPSAIQGNQTFDQFTAQERANKDAKSWAYGSSELINEMANYYSGWNRDEDQKTREFQARATEYLKSAGLYKDSFTDRQAYNDLYSALREVGPYSSQMGGMYSNFSSRAQYDRALQVAEWQNKYSNYSYSDKQRAIREMRNSADPSQTLDERRWLESTLDDNVTASGYQEYIDELNRQLEDEKTAYNRGRSTAALSDPEAAANEYLSRRSDIKAEISRAKSKQFMLEQQEKYDTIAKRPDFIRMADVVGKGDILNTIRIGNPEVNELLSDKEALEYFHITDTERKTYAYLYNTQGEQAAKDYWNNYLKYQVNERGMTAQQAQVEKYVTDSGWNAAVMSAISVPTNLMSGVGLANVTWQNFRNAVAGEKNYRPIDYNSSAMGATRFSSAVRNTITQNLDKKGTIKIDEEKNPLFARLLNGKGLGFLYQTGMSMADSMSLALLTGALSPALGEYAKFTTVLLGGSAGSQGILTALERGASDGQALTMGLLNGLFETLFEEVSLDHFLHPNKNFLVNFLSQGFVEGSEEISTTFFNNIADICIMAANSERSQLEQKYRDMGYSAEDAAKMALKDMCVDMAWDFIGGFISGGPMGAVGGARVNIMRNASFANQARNMSGADVVSGLLEADPTNKLGNKMQAKLETGDIGTWNKAKMLNQTQQATINNEKQNIKAAVVQRLTELGETGNVEKLADAIVDATTSRQLGEDPKGSSANRISNSTYGQRVLNELNADNAASGEYSSNWTQNIQTQMLDVGNEDVQAFREEFDNYLKDINQTAQMMQDEDEAAPQITIEEASEKYGDQAQAMIDSYQGEDVAAYDEAWKDAYDMGRSGVPLASTMNAMSGSVFSEDQVQSAYDSGREASREYTRVRSEAIGQQQAQVLEKKKGRRHGTVRGDGVTIADLETTLNDVAQQSGTRVRDFVRQALNIISTFADATGVDVVLYNSATDENGNYKEANGRYEWKDSKIYIDINAGLSNISESSDIAKRTTLQTFSHEFVHFIEQWSPEQYSELRDVVMEEIARTEDPDSLIRDKMNSLKMDDYEKASREVVAEGLSKILPDSHFIENLAQNHQNIFQKLLAKLKEFLADLKEHFAAIGSANVREASYLQEEVDGQIQYLEKIVQAFDSAAESAVENYQLTLEGIPAAQEVQTEETVEEAPVEEPAETKKEPKKSKKKTARKDTTEKGVPLEYVQKRHVEVYENKEISPDAKVVMLEQHLSDAQEMGDTETVNAIRAEIEDVKNSTWAFDKDKGGWYKTEEVKEPKPAPKKSTKKTVQENKTEAKDPLPNVGSVNSLASYMANGKMTDAKEAKAKAKLFQMLDQTGRDKSTPTAIKNELNMGRRSPAAPYSGNFSTAEKVTTKQRQSMSSRVAIGPVKGESGVSWVTDGYHMLFVSDEAANSYANAIKTSATKTKELLEGKDMSKAIADARNGFENGKRITTRPLVVKEASGNTLIIFEVDGQYSAFNKKYADALDGGAYYLAPIAANQPLFLVSTNAEGDLTGFTLPVRMKDELQKVVPTLFKWAEEYDAQQVEYSARERFSDLTAEEADEYIEAGLPVAPEAEVEWSIRTNDKQMAKTEQYVDAHGKRISKKNLQAVRTLRDKVANYLQENEKELNLPNEVIGNPFVKNGSYDKSYDPTTVCVRSLGVLRLQQMVSERLGRPLTARENFEIVQEAFHWTDNPQCLYCFAALDRMAKSEYLMDFVNRQNRAVKALDDGATKAEAYQAFLPDGHEGSSHMQKVFNGIYNRWENGGRLLSLKQAATYENLAKLTNKKDVGGIGELAYWAEQYAQNASWAKAQRQYQAYNGQILKWSPTQIRKLNSHYGLRLNSHSEFSPAFILEYLQVYTDAAARGLKALEYTSDINAAKIFAPTGAAINMSISITGTDYNNMGEDAMQGCPWAEARAVRDKYANAGIVAVTLNDEQTRWALDQDWIDVVIPMHLVKTGDEIAKAMKWTNTKAISEDAKTSEWDSEKDESHIYPSQHLNDKETYLKLCEKNHLTPRFKKWLDHPNYMKLVNETRQATTEMKPLRPVFDEAAIWDSLEMMKNRGGYFERLGHSTEGEEYIADEMTERFKSGPRYFEREDGEVNPRQAASEYGQYKSDKVSYSKRVTDADYMAAVEANDMATAQEMVDEAAEQHGYHPRHTYHGTLAYGFRWFDKSKAHVGGNSGAGFYFSTSKSDSDAHYADIEGADNWFKRNALADQIMDAGEWDGVEVADRDQAMEIAKNELNKNPGTYDVYLKYNKPYIRNYRNSTDLYPLIDVDESDLGIDRADYDSDEDYEDDLFQYRAEAMADHIYDIVYHAYNELERHYEVLPGGIPTLEALANRIMEIAYDYESLTWKDIRDAIDAEGGIEVINDDWSESADASVELTRQIIEEFGFDAVIDKEVDSKFNQLSADTEKGTEHIIVFSPKQIKSANPVTYDLDGNVIPVTERFNSGRDDIYYQQRVQRDNARYMEAVESGDMDTAARMVRAAAYDSGFGDALPEQTLAYAVRTAKPPTKTKTVYKVFTVDDNGNPSALFVSSAETLPQNVWLDAQDTWHFEDKHNGHFYVPSTQNPNTEGGKTGTPIHLSNISKEDLNELERQGFIKRSENGEYKAKDITALAYRPGWHAGDLPFFPQGGMKIAGSNYENVHRYNQVVFECEIAADVDYTRTKTAKNGKVRFLDMQEMPADGMYKFATNPMTQSSDLGAWYISGSLKIVRALTQEECNQILQENGRLPQEWQAYQDKAYRRTLSAEDRAAYEKSIGDLDLSRLGYTGQQFDAARKTLAPVTYDDNGNVIPLTERFNPEINDVRYQQRQQTITDRELLKMATTEMMDMTHLTEGERAALDIINTRLDKLHEVQQKRLEAGRLYKEQMFTKGGDRAAAKQTLEMMNDLDNQIKRAEEDVLSVENKDILKRVLQQARRNLEAIDRDKAVEMVRRYRDQRNNAAAIKKYRTRIMKGAEEITNWILKPNSKNAMKNVPAVIRGPVIEILQSIDRTSKRMLKGGPATKADLAYIEQMEKLQDVLNREVNPETLYSGYVDLSERFMDNMNKVINDAKNISKMFQGKYILNQMDSQELKTMSEFITELKNFIHRSTRTLTIAGQMADLGDSSIGEMSSLKPIKSGKAENFFMWQAMRPYDAFARFGDGGRKVFRMLMRGQSQLAFDTIEIEEFAKQAYTEEEIKAWQKQMVTVKLGGENVQMPVTYAMGLYELAKRQNAEGHLYGNGVRIATFEMGRKKYADNGHQVTRQEIAALDKILSPRQKQVADTLQKYMAEKGGEWGNYVSVARFGIEQFSEKDYYPIASDGRMLPASADERPLQAALYALLNMSFTKDLKENANNRAMVYDIFDVFANHMSAMAQYHSFALPVLDTLKWLNYKQIVEEKVINEKGKEETVERVVDTVREQMARVFGNEAETGGKGKASYAERFVTNLLKSINGTDAQGASFDTFGLKALHTYNVAQIAYNARVVIQQPMAITRAALVMNYRNIARAMARPDLLLKNIKEMGEKSGIAAWKNLGMYDVNISHSMTDIIKHSQTFMQRLNEFGMLGAEVADKVTWATIWQAAKYEAEQKYHVKPSDKNYFDVVNDIFNETVYRTQVVDSVLTKNEYLRSKNFFARASGAFMSEPMTTYSMLASAYDKFRTDIARGLSQSEAWKKNGKMIGRTAVVFAISQIMLSAVQGVADAWRDDDKYETFGEKWWEAFNDSLIDELSVLNLLPIFRDVWSIGKEIASKFGADTYGFEPNQIYMQWFGDLSQGLDRLMDKINNVETNYTWYGAIYKLLRAMAGMTGLPAGNVARELVSAWNNTAASFVPSLRITDYQPSYKNEIKYAFSDGYLTREEAIEELIKEGGDDMDADKAYWLVNGWETGNTSKYARIKQAMLEDASDFDDAYSELTEHGVKKKEIASTLKSAIGSWYRGEEETTIGYSEAKEMLMEYLGMKESDADELLTEWSMKKDTGLAYGEMKEAYLSGDISYDEAVGYREKYGGAKEDVAISAVDKWNMEKDTGIEYDDLKQAYVDGSVSYDQAVEYRMKYGGYEQEEAQKVVTSWKMEIDTGIAYDDLEEAFINDKVSYNNAVQYRVKYGGQKKDNAEKTVNDWKVKKKYGYEYADIDDKFLKGKISASEAKNAYLTYGVDEEKADQNVELLEFKKKYPAAKDMSYAAMNSYKEYCEADGVPVDVFNDVYTYKNKTSADVDANGNAINGSKREKVLAYINDLPISNYDKDSLYFACGYAQSTLKNAPWH